MRVITTEEHGTVNRPESICPAERYHARSAGQRMVCGAVDAGHGGRSQRAHSFSTDPVM